VCYSLNESKVKSTVYTRKYGVLECHCLRSATAVFPLNWNIFVFESQVRTYMSGSFMIMLSFVNICFFCLCPDCLPIGVSEALCF